MIHTFQFQNYNIALDVESGAIHLLDRDAYAILHAVERGIDPFSVGVDESSVREVLEELRQLRSDHALDTEQSDPPAVSGGSVIKSLCLHVAHDCNLRCKYCFASTGEFHGERKMMPLAVAKKAIDFLMEHSGKRRHLEVDLFGGEPLMNFPLCKQIVAYGHEREKAYGKQIAFTMTTNCVALDDESTRFINDNMKNVVISLDGRKEVHDALRPTANGKGSYDIILDKAKQLVQARGDAEYYIRGTYTRKNLDFLEDVKSLVAEGFTQLSLEPVVLPDNDPLSIRREDFDLIRQEYEKLAAYYINERKNGTWFNFFHFMIDTDGGPCLRKRISGCGTGVEYAAVTPDGDIYPCHQFVGLPEWKMGDVFSGTVNSDMQASFSACNVRTKERCRDCWAKYYCSGGCAANAYQYNGNIMHPHETSCELLRMRTEIAIGIRIAEQQQK